MAVVAIAVKTIEEKGAEIDAEVILWPGWSLTDMRMNPQHSVYRRMLGSMFVTSVVFLRVEASNMITSQSINGDWEKGQISILLKESFFSQEQLFLGNISGAHRLVCVKRMKWSERCHITFLSSQEDGPFEVGNNRVGIHCERICFYVCKIQMQRFHGIFQHEKCDTNVEPMWNGRLGRKPEQCPKRSLSTQI